ncbi:MAG: 2-isopropylmalate synthase [Candidatus Lindowbacteria bacterium]|nr:2-isopropylmalate synthase [Candidatus Lindowbacteria bacterium]
MTEQVYIFDTTLRDGEQSPGASMTVDEKIRMALQLEKLGVDVIEAGFPIASPGEFDSVRKIAGALKGVTVAGLARANKPDIDAAWDAIRVAPRPRIHIFIATSDIHLKHKLRRTREQVIEDAVGATKYAHQLAADVEFSAEDATRSDPDYLCEVVRAVIDAGASVVNIPDTVGYATPAEIGALFRKIRENTPNIDRVILSTHCHNDLGMAVANSLAAVRFGARQVECTVNGIGERAGNAALEEIVMAIRTREDQLPFYTRISSQEIYRTSKLLSTTTGLVIPRNKVAIVEEALNLIAEVYKLEYLQTTSGNRTMATATVQLKHDSKSVIDSAVGDGPVDATYKSIERITGVSGKLLEYSINAVTIGEDAMGEAFVKVQFKDDVVAGRGLSTDVIEASAKAYLNALNKWLSLSKRK